MADRNLVQRRPAELTAGAGALAVVIAHLVGLTDATTITALAFVLGLVPAAVTWLVTRKQR